METSMHVGIPAHCDFLYLYDLHNLSHTYFKKFHVPS